MSGYDSGLWDDPVTIDKIDDPPKANGHALDSKSFHWADTSQWDTEPCPPREWAVPDRIPLR